MDKRKDFNPGLSNPVKHYSNPSDFVGPLIVSFSFLTELVAQGSLVAVSSLLAVSFFLSVLEEDFFFSFGDDCALASTKQFVLLKCFLIS